MKAPVDMSPQAVEERLREASCLSPLPLAPAPHVDMSPQAVEARLREWAELSRFCLDLARRPGEPASPTRHAADYPDHQSDR